MHFFNVMIISVEIWANLPILKATVKTMPNYLILRRYQHGHVATIISRISTMTTERCPFRLVYRIYFNNNNNNSKPNLSNFYFSNKLIPDSWLSNVLVSFYLNSLWSLHHQGHCIIIIITMHLENLFDFQSNQMLKWRKTTTMHIWMWSICRNEPLMN